tara:strand:- start:98 stop:316 length:219 start_codon:yes stop_codon:yes gene_type:complete
MAKINNNYNADRNTRGIGLTVSTDVYAELKAEAIKQRRSVSMLVRISVEDYLTRCGRLPIAGAEDHPAIKEE